MLVLRKALKAGDSSYFGKAVGVRLSISPLWVTYVGSVSLIITILGLYFVWHLPLGLVMDTVTLLLVAFIVLALSLSISPYLRSIYGTLRRIEEAISPKAKLSEGGDPPPSRKEEIGTTGGGLS